MRILYIGDSHIRSMIDGAVATPAPAGIEEVFFGAAVPQLADNVFSVENQHLISSSPKVREMFKYTGGSETIDLKSFDACVLVSWCSSVMFVFQLIGRRVFHLPKRLFSLEQKNSQLLSDTVYREYLQQGIENFWKLHPLIKEHINGEILVLQRPIKAEAQSVSPAAQQTEVTRLKRELYSDLCEEYETVIRNAGARFVQQPAETLTEQLETKREFCLGSVHLFGNDPHEEEEVFHMNKDYGSTCLREIRSIVGAGGR